MFAIDERYLILQKLRVLPVQYVLAATSKMTEFQEFRRFNNSIQVRWKEPEYRPTLYELALVCKYDYNDQINLMDKFTLLPQETTLTLTGLPASSECTFTLKAVYNPASIDAGISVSYSTLSPSK